MIKYKSMNNDIISSSPILSICIPTYNRSGYLDKTIKSIVMNDVFINTNKIQLVISNNNSTDNTDKICKKYADQYPTKIKYIKQPYNIFADEHIFLVPTFADGKYIKINNDTCMFKEKTLLNLLCLLHEYTNADMLFLSNSNGVKQKSNMCYTLNELISCTSYNLTWIGGLMMKNTLFKEMMINGKFQKYIHTKLPQIYIYAEALERNYQVLYNNEEFFSILYPTNKGGYNISKVFGFNYLSILKKYVGRYNGLSHSTFRIEKKRVIDFINYYYFDFKNQFSFYKTGYFVYLLPFYKLNLYFWEKYIVCVFKKIIFSIKKFLSSLLKLK